MITEGFLSEMDGDALWDKAVNDISAGEPLDTDTVIKLMVYPLSFQSLSKKQDAVRKVIALADSMTDDREKSFILSGMMVFGDSIIEPKDADEIRRRLMLTKVEKIIAKEMQDAVDAAVEKNTDKIACNLLRNGDSVDKVASVVGISVERVEALQAAMA